MNFVKQVAIIGSLLAATAATANPFCADLSDPAQLPDRYAKRGPFYADVETGWIVGADQLKGSFEVTPEVRALWNEIKKEFEAKGAKLVVLSAPPRGLFAPAHVLPENYNTEAAKVAFSGYISAMNEAGMIAPDLTQLADSSSDQEFYFKRDTHWTPKGAYASAVELGEVLGIQSADVAEVSFDQSYDEKGSLSAVVEKTCGARPVAESVASPVYAASGGASALLGDTEEASIALIGTSFSDRYKTDTYQVAGALAHVLGAEVENFSTTGGGLVGAMEAFIQSGRLDQGQFKTVIWETPYTTPLTNVSGLRQVLGALQRADQSEEIYAGQMGKKWQMVKDGAMANGAAALRFVTPEITSGKMTVEIYNSADTKVRVKLVKSNRVAPELQTNEWYLSLSELPVSDIKRIKFKLDRDVASATVALLN